MTAKMSTSYICCLCNLSAHMLQHRLFLCPKFLEILLHMPAWFIMTKAILKLCRVSIVYGYFHPCKFKTITNLALLMAKYFLYRCVLNEESLHFELYKLLVRKKGLMKQLIASKNNTITDFNKKWQPFISSNFISCKV